MIERTESHHGAAKWELMFTNHRLSACPPVSFLLSLPPSVPSSLLPSFPSFQTSALLSAFNQYFSSPTVLKFTHSIILSSLQRQHTTLDSKQLSESAWSYKGKFISLMCN